MRVLLFAALLLGLATTALAPAALSAPDGTAAAPIVVTRSVRTVVVPTCTPRIPAFARYARCSAYPYNRPYYRPCWYHCRTPKFYRPHPYRYAPRVYARYGFRYWRDYHGGTSGRASRYACVTR